MDAEIVVNDLPDVLFSLGERSGQDNENRHRKKCDGQLERRQGGQDFLDHIPDRVPSENLSDGVPSENLSAEKNFQDFCYCPSSAPPLGTNFTD